MPIYSIIKDNKIVNTIMAESLEDAEKLTNCECRELNESFPYGVGYEYDGTKWFNPALTIEEQNA